MPWITLRRNKPRVVYIDTDSSGRHIHNPDCWEYYNTDKETGANIYRCKVTGEIVFNFGHRKNNLGRIKEYIRTAEEERHNELMRDLQKLHLYRGTVPPEETREEMIKRLGLRRLK